MFVGELVLCLDVQRRSDNCSWKTKNENHLVGDVSRGGNVRKKMATKFGSAFETLCCCGFLFRTAVTVRVLITGVPRCWVEAWMVSVHHQEQDSAVEAGFLEGINDDVFRDPTAYSQNAAKACWKWQAPEKFQEKH